MAKDQVMDPGEEDKPLQGVNYLKSLSEAKAESLAEWMAEALAEGSTTKKVLCKKYYVSKNTLNKFLEGKL